LPVDPDEILIFKLRGIITEKKPQPTQTKPVPEQKPAPIAMPEPVRKLEEVPVIVEAPPKPAGLFARNPKPLPQVPAKEIAAPEKAEVKKQPGFFARKPVEQRTVVQPQKPAPYVEKEEEEEKVLEVPAEEYMALPEGSLQKPRKRGPDMLSIITGLLFIGNAALLGYFIYPQSIFVMSYIEKTGLGTFFLSWNYDYDTSVINLVLMSLMALSGILKIANIKISEFIGGIVGACMVLVITFEYLNSNATYLLLTSVLSFICIGALAFSRMSSVSMTEREEAPEEITWPRLETF
jgi:hypothetical protein